jgi:5-methylcytosine-specific restriction endonuclease McrA
MAKTARQRRNRRDRMFKQQEGRCWICGEQMRLDVDAQHDEYPTFEHVRPQMAGGPNALKNLRLSHRVCNEVRGRYHEWEGYEAA